MVRPLLVASLALGVFAGCGAPGDTTSSAANEATTPSTARPPGATDGADAEPTVDPEGGARPSPSRDLAAAARTTPAERAWVALRLPAQYDLVAAAARPAWVDESTCPEAGRTAVVDRAHQWGWLCGDGNVVRDFPITSARSQPDPGAYDVYAKDLQASSTISGAYSEMTHFVAFTHGKYQGARIAFHSVPTYGDGSFVQPLDTVGSADLFGASAGCIRVLPDDAVAIWDWLAMGDTVTVVS
jgi:hypothetical protein